MKKYLIKFVTALLLFVLLWAFVGFEYVVGDHEVGSKWTFFIKNHPSFQLKFRNPALKGLDYVPFENLSSLERKSFSDYCAIRFGEADIFGCYKAVSNRDSANVYFSKTDINAFKKIDDSPDDVAFVITLGTACYIRESVSGKVDSYTEVECTKGKGWILTSMKDHFEKLP
ncbi:MAG: hypothetical protein FWD67_05050 [Betaproteobacteria bacterium]|nr:hypothetical protein [Betaproteobacteria bacterium]